MSRRAAIVLGAAAVLAGCQRSLEEQEHQADVLRRHMQDDFDTTRAIALLAIGGKLDGVRLLARGIAALPERETMAGWRGAEDDAARARELATAETVGDACRGVARVAAACAQCHREIGATPRFAPPPPAPPASTAVATRMARHRWAADRMWEAMIEGTDAGWTAGAAILAEDPLAWSERAGDRGLRAEQLRDAARRAATVERADRGPAFGDLLVTCAACHADPTWLAAHAEPAAEELAGVVQGNDP